MTQELWTSVDNYIVDSLDLNDRALEEAQAACDAAGLPAIQVSTAQGKFLQLVAAMIGARNILEVGTLGGFSTICMGRALPEDGRLVSIEVDPTHAQVATSNIRNAGLADRVEVRLGNAIELLPLLAAERTEPFDMTFIDADKASIPTYFEWALRMSRPGSVIIVDNVVREGAVVDAESTDAAVQGVRRLNEIMAADSRVMSTVLQTVGVKGYDGFAVALLQQFAGRRGI
jgi:predicted O-methyltransferase YrrM